MICLTSNGLTSEKLISALSDHVRMHNLSRALIIVNADPLYRKNHKHLPRLIQELHRVGVTCECFDLEVDDINKLESSDILEFIGGNPFTLLDCIRRFQLEHMLQQFHQNNKVIIGISAGSVVLQKSIELIAQYSPEMNEIGLESLEGVGLVDLEVLPHYSRFIHRFDDFEARCKQYERKCGKAVIRIDDGQGVLVFEDQSMRII